AGIGRAQLLSEPTGPGSGSVSVAIDDSGDALVSWSDGTQVHVATRVPGHVWAERVLGGGGEPAAGGGSSGDALVVWHGPANADGHYVSSWKPRGRTWQQPRALPTPGGLLAWPTAAQLGLDARGDAIAVFPVWSGSIPYDTYLEASTAGLGQPFGAPQK